VCGADGAIVEVVQLPKLDESICALKESRVREGQFGRVKVKFRVDTK
jgi:hypothetical protein